jgi:hypothetical protein
MTVFRFDSPEMLLAVPAVAALVAVATLRRGGRGRLASNGVLFLVACLVAVAAASPSFVSGSAARPRTAIVLDLGSAASSERGRTLEEVARLLEARGLGNAEVTVLGLGRHVVIRELGDRTGKDRDRALARIVSEAFGTEEAGTGAGDLTRVLGLARAACPDARTVFLYSSGRFPAAGPASIPAGMTVHTFPIRPRSRQDLALLEIRASGRIREDAPFLADVRYRANFPGTGVIELRADGKSLGELPFSFDHGDVGGVTFRDLRLEPGDHVLRAVFRTGDDLGDNDAIETRISVGGRLKVALVARSEPSAAYASALRAQGVEVEVVDPREAGVQILLHRDVVILDEPSAVLATRAHLLGALDKFVRREGGGLFLVFGKQGFAPGEYGGGDLANLSPLVPAPGYPQTPPALDPAPKEKPPPDPAPAPKMEEEPRAAPGPPGPGEKKPAELGAAAVVILVDKSGSMAGDKIALAKQAAGGAADELREDDRLGVVAFDLQSYWVAPLMRAEEKEKIRSLLSDLVAGGGTNIYPALELAQAALRDVDANIKHVILVSDGFNQTVEDFKGLVEKMAGEGITISTIGVGEFFDPVLLSSLTYWSKGNAGRFDFAKDFKRIPKLVLIHTRWAVGGEGKKDAPPSESEPAPPKPPAKPPPPKEKPPRPGPGGDPGPAGEATGPDAEKPSPPAPRAVRVLPAHPAPPTAGIGARTWPLLSWPRDTRARELADVLLIREDGSPVLAVRQAGLGRVAAFAGPIGQDGRSSWERWELLGKFLAQTARWLRFEGLPQHGPRSAYAYRSGGSLDVRFRIRESDAGSRRGEAVLELTDGQGKKVRTILTRAAEGVYTGRCEGPLKGVLTGRLRIGEGEGHPVAFNPLPEEGGEASRPDLAMLNRIAVWSGGSFAPDPSEVTLPPGPRNEEVRSQSLPFLAAAAVLLPLAAWLRRRRRAV